MARCNGPWRILCSLLHHHLRYLRLQCPLIRQRYLFLLLLGTLRHSSIVHNSDKTQKNIHSINDKKCWVMKIFLTSGEHWESLRALFLCLLHWWSRERNTRTEQQQHLQNICSTTAQFPTTSSSQQVSHRRISSSSDGPSLRRPSSRESRSRIEATTRPSRQDRCTSSPSPSNSDPRETRSSSHGATCRTRETGEPRTHVQTASGQASEGRWCSSFSSSRRSSSSSSIEGTYGSTSDGFIGGWAETGESRSYE